MCGIVGYQGAKEQIVDVLTNGLKRLEYRGYDSAGIAIITEDENIYHKKTMGRVKVLEESIKSDNLPAFDSAGIAHTRWATHGVPSTVNAHPHCSDDKKIWLIHNGIIENYKELKEILIKDGIKFNSQTDSEVIAHLIRKHYQGDLRKAVLEVLSQLIGAFAIVVICADEPGRLVGAKKGSPLVLGIGKDEYILASDVSAVISRTRKVVYLEDGEIIDIYDNNYQISNFNNESLSKSIETVDWDDEAATKSGYEHYLMKEIMEQPKTIEDSCRGRLLLDEGNVKLGGLMDINGRLHKIKRVILVGIGTAYYACKLGEIYFEDIADIPSKAEMSPEFRYKNPYIDENTWVIAVSQSGETADTIAAIQEAKRKGALVTGVVNTVGSTISRITEAGVYNHIGPEISVASTKAFTSQLTIIMLHAIMLGRIRHMGLSEGQRLIKEIKKLPQLVEKTLKLNNQIEELAKKYYNFNNLIYIGRRYNFPIALEGALKIKEISYIHAEGLSGGELKHGFIALIDENMPTIAVALKDSVYEKQLSNIEEIKARNGTVIAIATEGDKRIQEIADDVIYIPESEEEIYPILVTVAFQLLAYHTSVLKGFDVDKPRNLAKSVTVE
jgi:glutamine---fructose-6-phosphate transaminase (isomerizing)